MVPRDRDDVLSSYNDLAESGTANRPYEYLSFFSFCPTATTLDAKIIGRVRLAGFVEIKRLSIQPKIVWGVRLIGLVQIDGVSIKAEIVRSV
jgi:hypothetical protein